MLACFVYALFGQPTPDNFGVPEIVVGALLVLTVSGQGLVYQFLVFSGARQSGLWFVVCIACLLGIVMIALGGAIVSGASTRLIMRDVIPFLFLALPVLLADLASQERYRRCIIFSILFVGVCLSMRALLVIFDIAGMDNAVMRLAYFGNAPSILFTGIYLLNKVVERLSVRVDMVSILFVSFFIVVLSIVLAGFFLNQQRASVLLLFMGLVVSLISNGVKRPAMSSILFAVCFSGGAIFWSIWSEYLFVLVEKTALVGANSRVDELLAAVGNVSHSVPSILFGLGWGAQFFSVAGGGAYVGFTHSLLTMMLLKSGVIGMALTIIYLSVWIIRAAYSYAMDYLMYYACLAPIMLCVLFYASHKSLDFGLVLLVMSAYAPNNARQRWYPRCPEEKLLRSDKNIA